MRSFAAVSAFAAFTSTVLAAPCLHNREDANGVNIVVQVFKATSETETVVIDTATSGVVGSACCKILDSGSFANFPISTNIDETGAGTLVIGATTYQVHEDRTISGGINFTRVYTNVELYLSCAATLSFPGQMGSVGGGNTAACFKSGNPTLHLAASSIIASVDAPGPEAGNLSTREAEPNLVGKTKRRLRCVKCSYRSCRKRESALKLLRRAAQFEFPDALSPYQTAQS